jgi:hypothetical protein
VKIFSIKRYPSTSASQNVGASFGVAYTIRKYARFKTLRISVKPGGEVVVSAPLRVSLTTISTFVEKQKNWIEKAVSKMQGVPVLDKKGNRKEYVKHKEEARERIEKKLLELNKHYGFSYKKVTIRNQSSRWGSCSKSGTLSFNYRLIFKSREVFDYVLVHELCHLREMNHSQKFWDLVSQTCPNYRELRRQLKNTA